MKYRTVCKQVKCFIMAYACTDWYIWNLSACHGLFLLTLKAYLSQIVDLNNGHIHFYFVTTYAWFIHPKVVIYCTVRTCSRTTLSYVPLHYTLSKTKYDHIQVGDRWFKRSWYCSIIVSIIEQWNGIGKYKHITWVYVCQINVLCSCNYELVQNNNNFLWSYAYN
jgi:hypothetical protein